MRYRNVLLTTLAVVLVALGIFAVVTFGRPTPAAAPQLQTVPIAGSSQTGLVLPLVQLEGFWMAEENGVVFRATVTRRSIEIKMTSGDGAIMNYWNGTFETAQSPGQNIESKAVETSEIYLSTAKTKTFSIGADSMLFEFKAMGMTKMVELKRA